MRYDLMTAQFLALTTTALIVGCSSRITDSTASSPAMVKSNNAQQISLRDRKSVTFTDLDSLRYDTGSVDSDANLDFQLTDSGLRYRILRRSNGRKPTASNTVTVNYRGWLDSGKEFDSSYERGKPISFPLSGVVDGWTEGMQLIGEGGMIELSIPGRLGYGTQGSPDGSVPPNATLHFIVELIRIQ